MRKLAVVVAAAVAIAAQGTALADGCMMVDEATWKLHRERAMINEPEQKAVVFFSDGKEQLIISPSYEGPSSNFAWVVPVPARPKVEIVKGALFHELAKLVMPRPAGRSAKSGAVSSAKPPSQVTVLERKTVGAYDVSVLSATDGGALMKWLAQNKYRLPDAARGPMESYVKEKWTFVACRIKAPGSAAGLKTGTLAPLKFTFASSKPVYPLRLSSANPKPFSLLVYLLLPSRETGGKHNSISMTGLSGYGPGQSYWAAAVPRGQKQYPTLSRMCRTDAHVYLTRYSYLKPADCKADIRWNLPKAASSVR